MPKGKGHSKNKMTKAHFVIAASVCFKNFFIQKNSLTGLGFFEQVFFLDSQQILSQQKHSTIEQISENSLASMITLTNSTM